MAFLIKEFLNNIIPSQAHWQIELLRKWETIIGKLKTHVILEKIQQDTLILGVYDSSWLQELYLLSPLILKTINENLDQSPIKNLRFKQAEKKNKKKISINAGGIEKTNHIVITLSDKQTRALEKIIDQDLRRALYNFLSRCYRENK